MNNLISLCREHLVEPAVLRWLLIRPSGTVSERRSDNRITYLMWHDMWVQYALRRDIGHYVDPFVGVFGPRVVMISTDGHGVAIVARFDDDLPDNPTASAMLAAVGIDWRVRGTAAWIGDLNPTTGLYGDLTDTQLVALRAIAAHCRI